LPPKSLSPGSLSEQAATDRITVLIVWKVVLFILLVAGEVAWIVLKGSVQQTFWQTTLVCASWQLVVYLCAVDPIARKGIAVLQMLRVWFALLYGHRLFRNNAGVSGYHPAFMLLGTMLLLDGMELILDVGKRYLYKSKSR
jgi:hypothetical protein